MMRQPSVPPVLGAPSPTSPTFPPLDASAGRGFNFDPATYGRPRELPGPVYGVGFTGQLPPGALLVVSPSLSLLSAYAAQWYSYASNHEPPGYLNLDRLPLPPDTVALRAGDVVCYPGAPRLYVYPACLLGSNNSVTGLPGYTGGNTTNAQLSIPWLAPFARLWRNPENIPGRIAYHPTPYVNHEVFASADAAPSTNLQGCPVSHASNVVIHIVESAGSSRLVAETGSAEVWWQMQSGYWSHNDADDFDAAGRGTFSATHDVESYVVPRGAVRVFVRGTSGSTCMAQVFVSEA